MSALEKLKSFDDTNYPPELERIAVDLSEHCWKSAVSYEDYCREMTVWMIFGVSQWAFGDDHGFLSCGKRTKASLADVVDELCAYVGADGDAQCAGIFNEAHATE